MSLLLACLLALGPSDPVPVDDFTLVDVQGHSHQLSRYADHDAVVLFVHGNGCPIVRQTIPALKQVKDDFKGRKVAFLMLNPLVQDSLESIRKEAQEYEMGGLPILRDESQLVAEGLEIERTAEVLLLDPKLMRLLYRGPVDDRLDYGGQRADVREHYLVDALESALKGEPIQRSEVPARGCAIFFESSADTPGQDISFNDDIVPILQQRCVSCHVEGGLAPWAMDSHRKVRGWSSMIREVVQTRRMPPGQLDPEFEEQFADVHMLTTVERQKLVRWIDAGARLDESVDGAPVVDALEAAPLEAIDWVFGEPDVIVRIPRQEIPATGVLDYIYAPVEIGNSEDLWVRALQIRPGDPEVLHHLLAFIRHPGEDQELGRESRLLGGYGPGKGAQELPEGTGRHLPAGSRLVFSLHYTPSGRVTADETIVGLYLHDEPPPHRLMTRKAGTWDFKIPPHDRDHDVLAWTNPFPEALRVHSFTPHMHLRGRRMRYTAFLPDGSMRPLVNIPEFNFDWQLKYTLKEPIELPRGTRILVNGAFDNSATNPSNPDPDKRVGPGLESWQEMFIGYFNFTSAKAQKAPRDGNAQPGESR